MSGSVSQLFVNCSSSLPFLQLRCPGTAANKSTLLVRHELFRAESLFRDHFQAGCAQRWQCPAGRRGGELVIYIHDPPGRVIINSHYHRPLVSLCSTTPHVHLCSVPISGVQMPSGLPEFPNEESPDQFDRYWWVVPHECNSLRPSEFRTVKSSRKVGLQRPLNDTLIGLLEIKICSLINWSLSGKGFVSILSNGSEAGWIRSDIERKRIIAEKFCIVRSYRKVKH